MSGRWQHRLTGDLDVWEVTLHTADVLVVRAHAFAEQDGYYVFVALMAGQPAYEYEVARVPALVVSDIQGGWPPLE